MSLTKLKTLEYRLLRKIREKLRNFVEFKTKATSEVLIEKFYKESEELCAGYMLPRPKEFYQYLCITGFNFITRGPRK